MKEKVLAAFQLVRDGRSADAVIADPDLNRMFVSACHELGLEEPASSLNQFLHNLRKAGALAAFPTSKKTIVKNQDEYRFASEIAIRFLERRDQATLDQTLCDPTIAKEFDSVAGRIAPGYTSFQYRWAALNLRKSSRLSPEIYLRLISPNRCESSKASELTIENISTEQGLYLIYDGNQTLYVGETTNLRKRLRKHLDHSDNKGLAHWLWEHGVDDLHVEYYVLPDVTTRVRKALERELISSRRPVFNVAM